MQIYIAQVKNNTNKTKMLKSHSPNVKQCQCFNFKKIQQELHNLKAGWLGKLSIMLTKLPYQPLLFL